MNKTPNTDQHNNMHTSSKTITLGDILASEKAKYWDEIWVAQYENDCRSPSHGLTAYELKKGIKCSYRLNINYPPEIDFDKNNLFVTDDSVKLFNGFKKMGITSPENVYDTFISFHNKFDSGDTYGHYCLYSQLSYLGFKEMTDIENEISNNFNFEFNYVVDPYIPTEEKTREVYMPFTFRGVMALSLLTIYTFHHLSLLWGTDLLRAASVHHDDKQQFHYKLRKLLAFRKSDIVEDIMYSKFDYERASPSPLVNLDEYYIDSLYKLWEKEDTVGIYIP